MKYRKRIYYTAEQRSIMWDYYQRGESLHTIARLFDRYHSSISRIISETGGIRPASRTRSPNTLSLSEREEISRGIVMGCSIRHIAERLNRSPSTVSREINRNGGMKKYRATRADQNAWNKAKRPKTCKLSINKSLSKIVAKKLKANWSPEQISGWLKRKFPGDEEYHVSHETIYKTLYIQTRGALKKELTEYLRSHRIMRRSRYSSLKGQGLGKIVDAVSISERPANVESRAIPGHWEGDLIEGSNKTFIATLVERHSRYVMLLKVSDNKTSTSCKSLNKTSTENYPKNYINH